MARFRATDVVSLALRSQGAKLWLGGSNPRVSEARARRGGDVVRVRPTMVSEPINVARRVAHSRRIGSARLPIARRSTTFDEPTASRSWHLRTSTGGFALPFGQIAGVVGPVDGSRQR